MTLSLAGEPVRGRLVDSAGAKPVAGGEVLVGVGSPRLAFSRVVARPDGTFTAWVPQGERLWLLARAPGFGAIVDGWIPSRDESASFELTRRHRLAGVVLDDGPTAGAEVRVEGALTSRIITDQRGRFATEEVGLKRFGLQPRRKGRSALALVELPGDVDGIELKLEPSVLLSVRVVDADSGAPISEATVLATSSRDLFTALDADGPGAYRGFVPWEDEYAVTVSARGYSGARVSRFFSRREAAPLEVPLRRSESLRGRVVKATGAPAAGRGVEACRRTFGETGADNESEKCSAATTGEDGTFYLEGLRPGTYLMALLDCPDPMTPPFRSLLGDAVVNCPGRFRALVQVPPPREVTLSLASGPAATFDVAIAERDNLCGCRVSIDCGLTVDGLGELFRKETWASSARFEVEPGACVVWAECQLSPEADRPCDAEYSPAAFARRVVEARPGQVTGVRFELAHPGEN